MGEHTTAVHDAIRQVPDYTDITISDSQIERLGGLTNLVHKVALPDQNIIVRIPGKGTEEYIDRAVEAHNAKAAARAGVSADVIWADAASGVMISRCIDNIETMTPELFASRPQAPHRAGTAFKALHQSGQTFQFRFELFSMIDEYLNLLEQKDTTFPDGYFEIVDAAQPVKECLSENETPLAPCHCDPLCENFLDDGTRMWIVDWEYSGMNDPMWDLADLSVEAEFTPEQEMEMLRAYFGGEPTKAQHGRVVIYKAMCDLLWTLWGLIQHADKNPAEDFWAYAINRFERCKALMNHPDFKKHLAAIG